MKYQVHKIGGSCLKSIFMVKDFINRVTEFMEKDTTLIIAISAVYGVTDIIRKCINASTLTNELIQDTITAIELKHDPFIKEIPDLYSINLILIDSLQDALKQAQELGFTEELVDLILITGERFASQLVVRLINKLTNERTATLVYPENIGLLTDGHFFNAMINFDHDFYELRSNIYAIKEKIICIPGFYGINTISKVTTFGASGTDYTASSIANILDAERVIFWKDTCGFMTADPKLVSSATIEYMNYDEALELAHFGAKILHPKCIIPAKLKSIPIEVRNIRGKEKTTILTKDKLKSLSYASSSQYKSIANIKNITLFKVYFSSRTRQGKILDHVTEKFCTLNLRVLAITTSSTVISFIVDNTEKNLDLSEIIKNRFIIKAEEISGLSFISVIGEGIANEPGVAHKIFGVLAKAKINIIFLSGGASPTTLQFSVANRDLKQSLNLIHKELFPIPNKNPKVNLVHKI